MALKIKLSRGGRTNRPYYFIVVQEARSRRDGKFVEKLGTYDPFIKEGSKAMIKDNARVLHWLNNGALPTDKINAILFNLGISHKAITKPEFVVGEFNSKTRKEVKEILSKKAEEAKKAQKKA